MLWEPTLLPLIAGWYSGGSACSVTYEEAIAGMKLLSQTKGIFAEAAGGVNKAYSFEFN